MVSFAKTGAHSCRSLIANVSGIDRPDDRDSWRGLKCRPDVRSTARQLHGDVQGAADEVPSGGASLVTVVQAADFWNCDHVTLGDGLQASGPWRVFR
jgi:hypothetical protein